MTATQPAAVSGANGFERARKVADAVLYEGYVLYPYRASARKNQIRWQFGVLVPRPFSEVDGYEAWSMQTECLLEGLRSELDLKVRFLQVQRRDVEGLAGPVESIEVDGRVIASWEEGLERELDLAGLTVADLIAGGPTEVPIALAGAIEEEPIVAASGETAGRIVRQRWPISGVVRVTASPIEGPYPLVRLRVEVENVTDWHGTAGVRDEAVRRALVGVHSMIAVRQGRFISLMDPPEFARPLAQACLNRGTWPVLLGEEGKGEMVLSAPITLSDYPEVAPESEGDFCDATEIDEILALRVMTLTEEEKAEARGTDPRAAAIIERCDSMPAEIFERLHGAIRSLGATVHPPSCTNGVSMEPEMAPWWDPQVDASVDPWADRIEIGAADVGKGTRVRLRPTLSHHGPRPGADAQDIFLDGCTAVVEGVFFDVDGDIHLAVSLEDDPAKDLHEAHGRYRYFRPEEVEVLEPS